MCGRESVCWRECERESGRKSESGIVRGRVWERESGRESVWEKESVCGRKCGRESGRKSQG